MNNNEIIHEPTIRKKKRQSFTFNRIANSNNKQPSRRSSEPPHIIVNNSNQRIPFPLNKEFTANKNHSLNTLSVNNHLKSIKKWKLNNPKNRKITPELLEIPSHHDIIDLYSNNGNGASLIITTPSPESSSKSSTPSMSYVQSSSNCSLSIINIKPKRIIKPELIGDVSDESIISKKQLIKYFDAKKNSMFNENNFEKYIQNNNDDNYEYYGYLINENNNSMPTPTLTQYSLSDIDQNMNCLNNKYNNYYKYQYNDNINNENDDNDESECSICSAPDDRVNSLYRRKMVNTPNNFNDSKLNRKITDYFRPLIT